MSAGAQITWDDEVKKTPQNQAAPQIQWDAPPQQDADYLGPNAEPYVQPRPGESFQDTMQRGVRMGRTVTPEQQRAELKSDVQLLPRRLGAGAMAATAPFGLAGLVEAPAATLLGLGGGTLLGGGARYATEALGGGPVAQDIATLGGSAVGGYLGAGLANPELGNLAASKLRYPATARQSQLGRPGTIKPFLPSFMQRWTVPDWAIPKGELGTPTNPGAFAEVPVRLKAPAPPKPELGTPENPGWYAKLPTKMPKALPPPPPEPGTAENPGWVVPIPGRMPRTTVPEPELGTPENPGLVAKIPTRMPKTTTAGTAKLPWMTIEAPEQTAGFVPKANFTPAEEFLQRQATAQAAGAATRTGSAQEPFEPLVYESPEEAAQIDFRLANLRRQASAAGTYHAAQGAAGRRLNLQQRIAKSYLPEGGGLTPLAGLPKVEVRGLPPMKTGEGTSAVNLLGAEAPRSNPSQEMMSRAHEEARLRSVLTDPRATAEEKDYARKVLGTERP